MKKKTKSKIIFPESVKEHIKKECEKSEKFKEAYEDFWAELNDKGTLKIVAEARKTIKKGEKGVSASKSLKSISKA